MRGVAIRSTAGSLARLVNSTVRSMAPVRRNSWTKNSDSSKVMPMAAKTTANLDSPVQHLGLPGDLGGQGRMGQAGAGEDGQLLSPHQGVQPVDGGDARLDKLVGVVPGGGVHGQAVDVPVLVGQDGGAAVDGLAHAVEHPAQLCPSDTPSWRGWPRKRILDSARLMPAEFSNSCTTAASPFTSSTWQRRTVPSVSSISPSSS